MLSFSLNSLLFFISSVLFSHHIILYSHSKFNLLFISHFFELFSGQDVATYHFH